MKVWISILIISFWIGSIGLAADNENGKSFYIRGRYYQDWMGYKSGDSELYSRLSNRLKLTLFNWPGDGWSVLLDVRSRTTLGEGGKSQFIIYNAYLSFDSQDRKLFFSMGQMNLYDSAGIGQLTGGIAGYKMNKNLSFGGYAGFEPDIFNTKWDFDYRKFGAFVRYFGPGAKQFILSYNRLQYGSKEERQFIYTSFLLPVKQLVVLYGFLEYEMGNKVKSEDKLSRLFLNGRFNLSRNVDIAANYSSGRGLDYHRFLLEQSQSPSLHQNDIERFYYSESYGVRLSVRPVKQLRLYGEWRESQQKDRGIRNHSNRLGFSAADIWSSGVSLYGNYTMNRGDASESDSFYVSASRSFGRLTTSLSIANYYNGVRFWGDGTPQIFHLPDRHTLTTHLFLVVTRALALSMQFSYTFRPDSNDFQFYVRMIYRK
jgi:hypothetical protein